MASGGSANDGTTLTFDGAVVWNGTEFVALPGYAGSGTFTSTTGTGTWTKLPIGSRVGAAARLGTTWVGIGGNASTRIYTSTDAKTWSSAVFPGSPDPGAAYPSPNVLSYYGIVSGVITHP